MKQLHFEWMTMKIWWNEENFIFEVEMSELNSKWKWWNNIKYDMTQKKKKRNGIRYLYRFYVVIKDECCEYWILPNDAKKKSLIISIRKIEIGIKDLTTYLTFCFNLCKYVQLVLTRYAACREIKRFCCAQYLTDSTLNTVAMKNRWSKNFWETRNLDRKLQGKKCS